MTNKKIERIHELARSLKELHLAATTEEALARAREIIESSAANGISVKEFASGVKKRIKADIELHKKEIAGNKDIESELSGISNTAKDAEFILKKAKKAQHKD